MLNLAITLVLLFGMPSSGSLLTELLYLIVPIIAGTAAALLAAYLTPDGVPETEREEITAQLKRDPGR